MIYFRRRRHKYGQTVSKYLHIELWEEFQFWIDKIIPNYVTIELRDHLDFSPRGPPINHNAEQYHDTCNLPTRSHFLPKLLEE